MQFDEETTRMFLEQVPSITEEAKLLGDDLMLLILNKLSCGHIFGLKSAEIHAESVFMRLRVLNKRIETAYKKRLQLEKADAYYPD